MVWQEVRKRTGINIDFDIVTPANQAERFNLIMGSGDYPDLIACLPLHRRDKAIEDVYISAVMILGEAYAGLLQRTC